MHIHFTGKFIEKNVPTNSTFLRMIYKTRDLPYLYTRKESLSRYGYLKAPLSSIDFALKLYACGAKTFN